jgi:hypothetical protein
MLKLRSGSGIKVRRAVSLACIDVWGLYVPDSGYIEVSSRGKEWMENTKREKQKILARTREPLHPTKPGDQDNM